MQRHHFGQDTIEMKWKIFVNISMKIFERICQAQRESECFHHPGVSVLILSLIKSAFGICDQPKRRALQGDDYN